MKKSEIKYAIVLGLLFLGTILFEIYKPKPIDWSETLSNRDKIPYGTYVLYDLLEDIFPGQEIKETRLPVYNFLQKDINPDAHYIFIANSFHLDEYDMNSLLNFAATGNSVFIAAKSISSQLLDTLQTNIVDTVTWLLRDTVFFVNPQLNTQPYCFSNKEYNSFFKPDSLAQTTILGQNGIGKPNFVKINFGKGSFYLHLLPLAFSNFYVLNDTTSDYAFKALSYLPPNKPVIWDEYINQGRIDEDNILRVIMQYPALRWAYYIVIVAVLLFIVFESKRRQRIIPVLKPLKNTTIEFLNVVSGLYFQKQDHKSIAAKKITFFLEHIRSTYYLPTNMQDEAFVTALSRKSGYPPDKTKYLFWQIREVNRQKNLTAGELVKLNSEIEDFNIFVTNIHRTTD